MLLPIPSIYDANRATEIYVERAGLVADVAEEYAKAHGIRPSRQDKTRIGVLGVDCQIGFCTPGASLFVPGAVEDTDRAIRFLYGNLDRITQLHFTMDTHRMFQIFHPAWWTDAHGKHPAPFTPISYDDVKTGKWIPILHPKEALEYTQKLEASGKYVLTIWPYHALVGGVSHALVPALMEAAMFHAVARRSQTYFEAKGTHPLTENYSVLSPEVVELGGNSVGRFNAAFFQTLMEYDRIYIFGQAKSHCVLWTLNDMRERIEKTDPALMRKIWILEDAMSPVPPPRIDPLPPSLDFPKIAERALADLARAGMRVVKTTDPVTIRR